VSLLKPGEEVEHKFESGRHGWLQVARGTVELNGKKLSAGDGAAISDEQAITIEATDPSEVLLFDLA
jgi:redox-sensitive bicupin YhaK (pirin superfamily)